MERLNEQQIEIIKGLKGTANSLDLERYQLQMNDSDYKALTGIDLKTLDRMYGETSVYFEVRYCKCGEHFEVQYTTMIKDSCKEELSGAFECDDFLELFSTKEEKTEDIQQKLQELFDNHFNEFENFLKEKEYIRSENKQQTVEDFFNDNMEEVVRKLKECYSDVVSCLKEEIVKELTADDIDDSLKEDIAVDWITDNSESALDKAIDNASICDVKSAIICYIDNNL